MEYTRRAGGWFAAAIVTAAGTLKLLEPQEFAGALRTWTLVPPTAIPAIALLVPAIEVGLGGAWLLGLCRRTVRTWLAVTLLALTCAYLVQFVFGAPPRCGCLGRTFAFENARHEFWPVLVRNSFLLLAICTASVSVDARRAIAAEDEPGGGNRRLHARGFSLLELIVSMAILGLLAALVLPSLGSVRRQIQARGSESNLRQHYAVWAAYCSDYKEVFPYFTSPAATRTIIRFGDEAVSIPYFYATHVWPLALADYGYAGQWYSPSFRVPGAQLRLNSYVFSSALLAVPAYWRPETRTGPDQWKPTRLTQVRTPSKKAMISELYDSPIEGSIAVLTVDAAVARVDRSTILPGYPRGEGRWPGFWFSYPVPTLHTIGGVEGADLP